MSGSRALVSGLVVASVGLASAAMAQPHYEIIDLSTTAGFEGAMPYGISQNGKITGVLFNLDTGELHAFIWDQGAFQDIGMFGYPYGADGICINNSGQVAGTGYGPGYHAVRYTNGQIRRLGSIDGGSSSAWAMNNLGHIVGRAVNGDGGGQGFVYINSMTALAVDIARGINDADQVVGSVGFCWGTGEYLYCADHAFVMTNGNMVELGDLGGGTHSNSEAYAINNAGQVTGYSTTASGEHHAFRTGNGEMTDLGTFEPYQSTGLSIAANGDVAGVIQTYGGATIATFVYTGGTMYDLDYLLGPRLGGWTDLSMSQMNDNGWIVGVGTINGESHGFLARPVACTADFNADGAIDFFDYLDFVSAFSSLDAAADFNADGSIDFFDYLDFVNAFSIGC